MPSHLRKEQSSGECCLLEFSTVILF